MASRLPVTKQEVKKAKKNHCGRYVLKRSGKMQ